MTNVLLLSNGGVITSCQSHTRNHDITTSMRITMTNVLLLSNGGVITSCQSHDNHANMYMFMQKQAHVDCVERAPVQDTLYILWFH